MLLFAVSRSKLRASILANGRFSLQVAANQLTGSHSTLSMLARGRLSAAFGICFSLHVTLICPAVAILLLLGSFGEVVVVLAVIGRMVGRTGKRSLSCAR